jgi:hypothetical protein
LPCSTNLVLNSTAFVPIQISFHVPSIQPF